MIIIKSKQGVPIRLSTERWEHIRRRHPEIKDQKDKVLETITAPDVIQQGDYGELLAIKFFENTPLTEKYLVVIYKEINKDDGFVITAYFTKKPSERRLTVWRH